MFSYVFEVTNAICIHTQGDCRNFLFRLGSVQYLTGPGVAGFTGGYTFFGVDLGGIYFFRSRFRGGILFSEVADVNQATPGPDKFCTLPNN